MVFVTFDQVKALDGVLPFAECEAIYYTIRATIGSQDQEFNQQWNRLIQVATVYVEQRGQRATLSAKQRQDKQGSYQEAEQALVAHMQALVTYLESKGWSTLWYPTLRDDRAKLGDFASYLVYLYSLAGRN